MLFNSHVFLFLYLPIVFCGFFALARVSRTAAAGWLGVASLFFYGWWSPAYLWLLLGSIAFNFVCGRSIALDVAAGRRRRARWVLGAAIGADLALLAYYKYANFFVASLNAAAGSHIEFAEVVLPIGISFFTFTQIAFLVDAWQGKVKEQNPVHYILFVSYFPHLIAGPVLHHAEMMPQFARPATYRLQAENIAVGLVIFSIGLFKKVMLADPVSAYAKPVFDAAAAGTTLSFLEAWCGALAYTLQLYFDFSGYSDMAIGLSRLFGVVLPLNFASPYKSASIIEFWRRWHMTLSRFLRDYLYIPLGGGRHGVRRRYLNLFVTMLLGGLWHGAGWTFVLWGALHGVYLAINHGWRELTGRLGVDPGRSTLPGRMVATLLTFVAVVVGWVLFRATDVAAAVAILRAMAGLDGVALPPGLHDRLGGASGWLAGLGVAFDLRPGYFSLQAAAWILALLAAAWSLPNTQELMAAWRPGLGAEAKPGSRLVFRMHPVIAIGLGVVTLVSLFHMSRQSEFLYFQF